MKYTQIATALILSSCSVASAASLSLANFTGNSANDFVILDSMDNGLSNGFLALYAAPSSLPTDANSAFTVLGTETALASTQLSAGNSPTPGLFSTALSFDNTSGNFNGVNLLFVIGNGSDLGNSSEIAVFNTSISASTSDAPNEEALGSFAPSDTTAIAGTRGSAVTVDASPIGGPPFASYNAQSINLEVIPEPSSALLTLLGGVALLRRRRA